MLSSIPVTPGEIRISLHLSVYCCLFQAWQAGKKRKLDDVFTVLEALGLPTLLQHYNLEQCQHCLAAVPHWPAKKWPSTSGQGKKFSWPTNSPACLNSMRLKRLVVRQRSTNSIVPSPGRSNFQKTPCRATWYWVKVAPLDYRVLLGTVEPCQGIWSPDWGFSYKSIRVSIYGRFQRVWVHIDTKWATRPS